MSRDARRSFAAELGGLEKLAYVSARTSHRQIRDALAGKDVRLSRTQGVAYLLASELPDKEHTLAAILANREEPLELRLVVASALGCVNSPEAEAALLERFDAPEEALRAGIAIALGRIGATRAFDRLVQASREAADPIRSAARFAAVLVSHRLRKPGFELPFPAADDLFLPVGDRGAPIRVTPASEGLAHRCVRCLRYRPLGVRWSEARAVEVRVLRHRSVVLLNAEFEGKEIVAKLRNAPALFGVLVTADLETGLYLPKTLLLSSPDPEDDGIRIYACSQSGQVIAAGKVMPERRGARFSINGVAGLGAVPLRIEGVLDEGRLQVTTAIAAAGHRVRVRTSPDPRSARRQTAWIDV